MREWREMSESGQEESRNLKRRQMRSQRRQTRRRVRRLSKLFRMLQRFGLMPSAELSNPEERQELLNQLDREILTSDWFKSKRAGEGIKQPDQLMPFLLRAAAWMNGLSRTTWDGRFTI